MNPIKLTTVLNSNRFFGGERWLYNRLKVLSKDPSFNVQIIMKKCMVSYFSDIKNAHIVTLPNVRNNFIDKVLFFFFVQFYILYKTITYRSTHVLLSLQEDLISAFLTILVTKTQMIWQPVGLFRLLKTWGMDYPKKYEEENITAFKFDSSVLGNKKYLKQILIPKLTKKTIHKSDIIICPNQFFANFLCDTMKPKSEKNRKFIVAYGFPDFILDLDFSVKIRKSIIFPHRLIKWKRTDLLIDLIPMILDLDNEINFFIMGDNQPYFDKLKKLAKKYSQLKLLGYVKDPLYYFKQTELCLQFVVTPTPQNNVILNAFNTGCVMCLPKSSLLENWFLYNEEKSSEVFVIDGTNDEIAEQIVQLLRSPDRIRQIAINAYNLLKRRHNPDNFKDQLIKCMRNT